MFGASAESIPDRLLAGCIGKELSVALEFCGIAASHQFPASPSPGSVVQEDALAAGCSKPPCHRRRQLRGIPSSPANSSRSCETSGHLRQPMPRRSYLVAAPAQRTAAVPDSWSPACSGLSGQLLLQPPAIHTSHGVEDGRYFGFDRGEHSRGVLEIMFCAHLLEFAHLL